MNQVKRKIILIKRGFQLKIIWKFILANALILTVFGGFIYIFFDSEISANLASAHVAYKNFSQMLFPIILTLSVINLLFMAIIISIMVLYSSHKVAGPMYRFNEALNEIAEGNLKPLTKIRETDQLQELSGTLTRMTNALSADIVLIREKIVELRKKIPEEYLDGLDELTSIIEKYKI